MKKLCFFLFAALIFLSACQPQIENYENPGISGDLTQIGDYLYFVKKSLYLEGEHCFEAQIYRIKTDDTEEEFVYTFQYDWHYSLSKLNSDNLLLITLHPHPVDDADTKAIVLDLNTKTVESLDNMSGIAHLRSNPYYLKKIIIDNDNNYDRHYDLYKANRNSNEILIQQNVGDYQIYKNKIYYTKYNEGTKREDKNWWVLLSCGLDGKKPIEIAELQNNFFTIQNDIVYTMHYDVVDSCANYGTITIDLINGKSELRTPCIDCFQIKCMPDYFITNGLFGKEIYKISYDWESAEIIAEYYCDYYLIGEYLYLYPMINENGSIEDYDEFAVKDGIYRMKLDGSGFEKFVELDLWYAKT